tara:strand:- start:306 stop:530 length:225 start_codon:yes stop_codon:yes gene_type:complete
MLSEYYKLIGNEVEQMVNKVENKPKTTQDRYGDYMHLISVLIDNKLPIGIACQLLIKCGGNVNGVTSARKCITL